MTMTHLVHDAVTSGEHGTKGPRAAKSCPPRGLTAVAGRTLVAAVRPRCGTH
jgi:hypothetical protein